VRRSVATALARQPSLKNVFGSQPDTVLACCQVVSVHVPNVPTPSLEKVAELSQNGDASPQLNASAFGGGSERSWRESASCNKMKTRALRGSPVAQW
jgi:hypothetical protein